MFEDSDDIGAERPALRGGDLAGGLVNNLRDFADVESRHAVMVAFLLA